jgi:uncharacterized repeat protein (TIGR03803 family)
MKVRVKNLFLLPTLIAGLGLMLVGPVTAQTFTNLHSFTLGSDGTSLQAGLVLSGNTLYGATEYGGEYGYSTVFAVNTNGSGFRTVYNFSAEVANSLGIKTNSDGNGPDGTLILSGNTLYGTAYYGGTNGNGTVFAVNTNGTFTTLHSFSAGSGSMPQNYTNSDGANPESGLILSGNTLYGTTENGGTNGYGVVFKVNTNGIGFTNLHSFTGGTNGAVPQGLLLSGNTLYGVASSFYMANATVFKINTDGTGFTNLHSFTTAAGLGLLLSGNTLYGTAGAGTYGNGTIFAVNTDGTGFTNLYSFTAASGPNQTNSDGFNPVENGGLIISGNTLYGTAYYGGSAGIGTVFSLNTNGSGFTTLHNFNAGGNISIEYYGLFYTNSDGANPYAGLILSGQTLYGTAKNGGGSGGGAVFSISLTLVVTTTSLPSDTNGLAYNQTLAATGGQKPYSWTNSSGALPPGLTLATNGVISGTPTTNGAFYFIVKVTDANSSTATQALELTVDTPPQVTTVTLPNGLTGVAYSQQLSAIPGQPPYSWSIIYGFLPDGLELTTNGLISGTPTGPEIASFTVMVTDALSATGTMPLTLAISTSNSVSVFTPLYYFSVRNYTYYTNSDGCYPEGGLILLGNTLYGMTEQGGPFGQGTVFAVKTNDTGFTNLHSFTGFSPVEGGSGSFTHLVSSGSRLYGTTSGGGTNGVGTVFAVNTDGTGFTNLYCFSALDFSYYTNSDGAAPMGGLVLSGNNLYGTTWTGGRSGNGTVFTVSTNGTRFTNLYNFVASHTNSFGAYTNSSGASPNAPLLLSGNRLYGTANLGGSSGIGTVFAVNTDGSGFSNLYCFSGWRDGGGPNGGLLLSGNTLYGTTSLGGSNYDGVVFAINTDGTDYTNLYSFSGGSDGGGPNGGLLLSGNTLYGTTYWGGNNNAGSGSVFAISTNGTDFTNLYVFDSMNEGPNGDLLLTGNTLYGTTQVGGNSDFGTIFSLSLLGMAPSSNSTIIMLSSPQITVGKTNFTFQLTGPAGSNYVLQISTNLLNWTTNSTSTIPVSGTVNLTNAITNYNRLFYRVHLQ